MAEAEMLPERLHRIAHVQQLFKQLQTMPTGKVRVFSHSPLLTPYVTLRRHSSLR